MIRKTILFVAACALSFGVFAKGGGHSGGSASGSGSHSVKGYTKKDGTYVAPSHATNSNNTKADNYSSKGNVNPYTGKEGTK